MKKAIITFLKVIFFPLKILCLSLIYFYKLAISPCLPCCCKHTPSCSTYAILAIKEFGVLKGIFLATKRILKCNPKSKGGYDPIPINIKGDIRWIL